MRNLHRFITGQLLNLDLKILRKKFAYKYCFIHESHRAHALPQVRRQVTCSFHDPFRLVRRHFDTYSTGSRRLRGFFDIHNAILKVFPLLIPFP